MLYYKIGLRSGAMGIRWRAASMKLPRAWGGLTACFSSVVLKPSLLFGFSGGLLDGLPLLNGLHELLGLEVFVRLGTFQLFSMQCLLQDKGCRD
jgi:hypothetical protein